LRVADLELPSKQAGVGTVKAEGTSRNDHDTTLERLRIHGYDTSQQNDRRSTKCPPWNWIIKANVISAANRKMDNRAVLLDVNLDFDHDRRTRPVYGAYAGDHLPIAARFRITGRRNST